MSRLGLEDARLGNEFRLGASPGVSGPTPKGLAPDALISVSARDIQTGEQWTFQDIGVCPTLEKGMNGDGPITWQYDFTQFQDRLPPRHAYVEVSDDLGVIQTGRIAGRNPPGTDLCNGPCTLKAESLAAAGGDRKLSASTIFGPKWDNFSLLALTPEDAVTYAVSQLGGTVGTVANSGFVLTDTEDYQGRTWQDVANSMSSIGAGLATPFVWSVKQGVFNWGPIDLAPKYQTLIASGAVITPSDDAGRLYTRVIVLWGKGQAAIWPDTIDYAQLPTIVDLVVNAGAEVKGPGSALQMAQGLYGRLQFLELGWSWNFTIPGQTAIERIGQGPIYPWRVECASVLRVPDFDPASRYGNKHPSPESLIITSLRWDGQNNQLTGTCGEIRDPSQFVRKVMYTGTPSVSAPFLTKPGTVRQIKDAGKIEYFGPYISTSTASSTNAVAPGPSTSPAIIDHKIPPVDTKQDTFHPTALPPLPPAVVFHDADPTTTGVKAKFITPPVRALSWTLAATGPTQYAATFTRRSNGATIAAMDLAGASEVLDHVIGSPSFPDSTVGQIDSDDLLIYTVTTPASSTDMAFVDAGIRTVRYFPGYVGNKNPITGGK